MDKVESEIRRLGESNPGMTMTRVPPSGGAAEGGGAVGELVVRVEPDQMTYLRWGGGAYVLAADGGTAQIDGHATDEEEGLIDWLF